MGNNNPATALVSAIPGLCNRPGFRGVVCEVRAGDISKTSYEYTIEVEKGVVLTVFEMSPARASQTTPQKPAIPDKPRIAD